MDPQAGAVPVEQFDQRAGAIGESEDRAATRILAELADHQCMQAVEGLPHVAGFQRQENPQAAGESQHDRGGER